MASYGYEALDKSGKVIKGSIDADSVDQAKVLIKKQGYVPTSIKEQSLMTKDINIQIGGKVTPQRHVGILSSVRKYEQGRCIYP